MGTMAGHWASAALCNILHLKARIRGACSERSDTYHVQGVHFLPAEIRGMAVYFFRARS